MEHTNMDQIYVRVLIIFLKEDGRILDILDHPTRPNQQIYIVKIKNYAVLVPFVRADGNFLEDCLSKQEVHKEILEVINGKGKVS
jgi:hypothetical protein